MGALSEELRRDEAAAAARARAGAAERARFSAHLVLSFRALARRLAAAGDAGDEGDRGLMHFLQGGAFALDVDSIVTNYVLHLMEAEEYLVLVSYLAWVAPDAREATFVGFLGRLAEAPLEDKRAIYDEARPLFEPSARDIGSAASGAIRAANELRAAAPPGGVGVAGKRAAGEWLVCAPELRAHALCYACAVLRELALGGEASKAAKRVPPTSPLSPARTTTWGRTFFLAACSWTRTGGASPGGRRAPRPRGHGRLRAAVLRVPGGARGAHRGGVEARAGRGRQALGDVGRGARARRRRGARGHRACWRSPVRPLLAGDGWCTRARKRGRGRCCCFLKEGVELDCCWPRRPAARWTPCARPV